jgi:toxin-antitoxin system PIN domain toxin
VRLLDANLLLYATFDVFPAHKKARLWLDGCLNADARVGIPWETVTAFVRLASNPRVIQPCLSVRKAWVQAQYWLACDNVWTPAATSRHGELLGALLSEYGITHKHVADAHLAALAIEHGLILASADADFSRFSGLRYENPLTR